MAKLIRRPKNSDNPEVTAKYYLTNGKMLPEVIKSKEAGKISNELAKMLMMLTQRYASRPCFYGYSYKEDMISDALTSLCQNALKFNPEKSSNPFSFYTTCINHSFLQFLSTEKRHRRIRDQLLIDVGENPSFSFQEEAKNHQSGEYKTEIDELKTQIEEAKIRMKQDAEYAAAKAAKDAAALANANAELDPIDLDEFANIDLGDQQVEELITNISLLDFEGDLSDVQEEE